MHMSLKGKTTEKGEMAWHSKETQIVNEGFGK